jgi:hypothetical protein
VPAPPARLSGRVPQLDGLRGVAIGPAVALLTAAGLAVVWFRL